MAACGNGLPGPAEPVAFEFLAALFCFEGDGEATDFAINPKSFASYFEEACAEDESASGDDNCMPLLAAFAKFKKKLIDVSTGIEKRDDADVIPVVIGDETSEQKSNIYKQVNSKRKERQTFYHLPNWEKPWGNASDATGIFSAECILSQGERLSQWRARTWEGKQAHAVLPRASSEPWQCRFHDII